MNRILSTHDCYARYFVMEVQPTVLRLAVTVKFFGLHAKHYISCECFKLLHIQYDTITAVLKAT